ncbi:hypothetical protein CMV_025242 [Castanea mollissima]|nr:hypothetical protein CMV_025242 [Castanea mollissima]
MVADERFWRSSTMKKKKKRLKCFIGMGECKFSNACIIPESQPPDPEHREGMFSDNLGMRAMILNCLGSKFSCFTKKYFQGTNFPNLSLKYCSNALIDEAN